MMTEEKKLLSYEEFNEIYDYELTRTERKVLRGFLAGKHKDVILDEIGVTNPGNYSHHMRKLCEKFEISRLSTLSDASQQLIKIFYKHKPELISMEVLEKTDLLISPPFPEGSVPLNSVFYVERPPIESSSYQEILKPGCLIRIKAPRQMGKTSLTNRILDFGVKQTKGYAVQLNLLEADQDTLSSLDKFLYWFCGNVGEQLNLEEELDKRWKGFRSSNQNCTKYFEQYVLPQINSPLFLALDEVDRIFQYPDIAPDFFGMLRVWHEKAKNEDIWQQLRLVVVYSTEVFIPLNINQSPFNVGMPIELPEFNSEQVGNLAYRHRLEWEDQQINELMAMVGGHPYLVRLAMYYLSMNELKLEDVLEKATTNEGIYSSHLLRLLASLEKDQDLADSLKKVVTADAKGGVELEPLQTYKLYSMGLVQQEGNKVKSRCNLYYQFFARVL
ncbi:MAG: AAA-like domain-containing protein [Gomphosphaeria aponina SAG 52.96 = DSM 107014]|uniref:AAA-like domain-containing protein n=1 Tax=Gomphosphaeria aponina SAG 52.96 = DSM 107014 TaxID=1521640 RepID=A0A941GRW8_9CHRO|nr:AAA-like domain-containing protein [Gomphosphaeria aponina SAG 52.96 = DSM 107014]